MEKLQALDPEYSVLVSASAGAGKTTLLKDRYISLILNDIDPQKILCLTYTNSAAREMKHRILLELGNIINNPAKDYDTHKINKIEQIYNILLHNQEKFRVKTIHSFCLDLLKNFPIESKLEVNFSLLNSFKEKEIIRRIIDKLENVVKGFSIPQFINFEAFKEIIHSLINNINLNLLGENSELINHVNNQKKVILNEIKDFCNIKTANLHNYLCLEKIKKKHDIIEWLQSDLTFKKHNFLSYALNIVKIKKSINIYVNAEIERVNKFLEKYFNLINSIVSLELIIIYKKVIEEINIEKNNYFLSFNDVIVKTKELLENKEYNDWVLYNVDNRIDHLLIDEAQDTNLLQWQIIDKITEEFFSGRFEIFPKTIFIVGDLKQAIYSFQGSDYKIFSSKLNEYEKKLKNAKLKYVKVNLSTSYRNSLSIINLVNQIFYESKIFDFLDLPKQELKHFTNKMEKGLVIIDPLIILEENEKNLNQKQARIIIERIKNLISSKKILPSNNKEISYKDIMILVVKRGELYNAIINELNNNQIPNSGFDRFLLNDSLIINDIINIAKFVKNPEDHFYLINLLKSPLFKLKDFELEEYLNADNSNEFIKNNQIIKYLLEQSLILNGIEFFIKIIKDYKSYFITSYNEDYDFITSAFIENLYSIFLNTNILSLEYLTETIINMEIQLVKESTFKENQIKIMTIHSAKGLEAPIVFLPDTTKLPASNDNYLIDIENQILAFKLKIEYRTEIWDCLVKKQANKDYEEYLRLLYVAITRAKDALYISGSDKTEKINEKSWYSIISNLYSHDN